MPSEDLHYIVTSYQYFDGDYYYYVSFFDTDEDLTQQERFDFLMTLTNFE